MSSSTARPYLYLPNWEESDLTDRWLIEPAYKEMKYVVDLGNSPFTREQILNKVRNLTSGKFFMSDRWVQFEDEKDYIMFRLSV